MNGKILLYWNLGLSVFLTLLISVFSPPLNCWCSVTKSLNFRWYKFMITMCHIIFYFKSCIISISFFTITSFKQVSASYLCVFLIKKEENLYFHQYTDVSWITLHMISISVMLTSYVLVIWICYINGDVQFSLLPY